MSSTRQVTARRFAYEEANGEIPPGMRIHAPNCPALCVRPDHLMLVPRGRVQEKTHVEHFWDKVDKSAGPDACWRWLGAVQHGEKLLPYGIFSWWDADERRNRTVKAPRMAWELTNGPITGGLHIRHVRCRNPNCVNPAHLALGTAQDNVDDAVRDGTRVRKPKLTLITPGDS